MNYRLDLTTTEMELIHTLMYHMTPVQIREASLACIAKEEREYVWGQHVPLGQAEVAYRSLARKLDTVVRITPRVISQ